MKLLVTGANRGLGLALTTVSIKRGHKVFAGVRDLEQRTEALQQLQALFPKRLTMVPLDITDEKDCRQAAQQVKEETGDIDVIISNAGLLTEREKTIEQLDMSEVQKSFDVNLFGPMRVVKHFLPILAQGDQAAIIHISSEAGSFANAYGGDYPYALSKHALNMFTEQLRQYLKEKAVSVYAVHPGWIKTDMGGDQAPGSPQETAHSIIDILEGKKQVTSQSSFIDFKGNPMPF
ncbi:NAD(P)-dependent dehydrogenase (short-subunit alcohol dehydrogenase family) [Pullulanibacillus pueri]|uniref:Short-chain dehydrogenase n=1 Tax=Pullulanibacillus pueri TaxID=1437324 RepID=A0A8J2ZRJ4_9BACL|nr:SDR family oxidoreductase [Pullulanibacillus pueri]MBM7679908.1 NAD(P)-dependent dehydrogenase (short-subunit alcohol dehydrogenase family) [Pullulanibacillus pueri]GGH73435.1 short-chain dehydrogenase [Pullulanibacillus pueri]